MISFLPPTPPPYPLPPYPLPLPYPLPPSPTPPLPPTRSFLYNFLIIYQEFVDLRCHVSIQDLILLSPTRLFVVVLCLAVVVVVGGQGWVIGWVGRGWPEMASPCLVEISWKFKL